MTRNSSLCLVLSLLLTPVAARAQSRDLGGARPLRVRVHVTTAPSSGDTSSLGYTVENLRTGDEDLVGFLVAAPATVVRMPAPAARHWLTEPRYDGHRIAQWVLYHSSLLHPGETSPELTIVAIGVPDLVRYWAMPNLLAHPADIDDDPHRDDTFAFSDTGTTVGIVPPPADASPARLATRLRSLLGRACGSLGWITQAGICTSLDEKLIHAQRALAGGSLGTARDELGAFLSELEAQHGEQLGKHVSDEAYSLLRPNVTYLRDRLR